jgi:hypothetical protein
VFTFLRDLLLGFLAWFSADTAVDTYPKHLLLGHRPSDYLTLILFKPVHMLLSILFFLFACYLLFYLIKVHGRQSIFRPGLPTAERMVHLVLFGFAVFLLVIQAVKIPLPTVLTALLIAVVKMRSFLRHRALLQEMRSYLQRKK